VNRAALIGTGLIGGSVGLALRRAGFVVRALDRDPARVDDAKRLGVVDEVARSIPDVVAGADLVIVAVPVGQVADIVVAALDADAPVVTDVGSAKGAVVAAVEAERPDAAPRFVGGHPMAGSEQDGLEGADADLFVGATWVLTPTERTSEDAFQAVRTLVRSLGAEVLAVTPGDHDALVAMVSHVPQLAATTLMDVASRHGEEHATLLRLAAGGFRDMTRIAASAPGIWSDICAANGDAIVRALDDYLAALQQVRSLLVGGDDEGLLALLERARAARRNLPIGVPSPAELVELRVPVPDRSGVLAEVTTLAGRLDVNIVDVEIAHSLEGGAGVLLLVVPARGAAALEAALTEHGYHHSRTPLS
jgi:prephenate dehydrogenase